jgi:hypothetical protein
MGNGLTPAAINEMVRATREQHAIPIAVALNRLIESAQSTHKACGSVAFGCDSTVHEALAAECNTRAAHLVHTLTEALTIARGLASRLEGIKF